MTSKEKLIQDVEQLLNTYDGVDTTVINPALFEFMDEETIVNIVSDLLMQKEDLKESDKIWLEQFKKVTEQ